MKTTRRHFLAAGALGAAGWLAKPHTALASVAITGTDRPGPRGPLITIFLRGGADGLNVVVPYADDDYYRARPTLALPRPGRGSSLQGARVLDLDGFFGLHPALSALMPLYAAGEMAIVHACGSGDQTRSHFEAMATVERGSYRDTGPANGWLARHLDSTPWSSESPLRAVAIGEILPDSLRGAGRAAALTNVSDYRLDAASPALVSWYNRSLVSLYGDARQTSALLGDAGLEAVSVLRRLQDLSSAGAPQAEAAVYPHDDLGVGLSQVACLIKSEIGLEAACLDHQGYDTHVAQGGSEGILASRLNSLAAAVSAFARDLGPKLWADATVVVITEFGRRVAENDGAGTDHGRAGVLFVLGGRSPGSGARSGGIAGGRVHGRWPGLSSLEGPGDVPVTTDYRDVLAEVLSHRIGNPMTGKVFPGLTPRAVGVIDG